MRKLNIGKAFSYVFDDPKWVSKVLIGGIFLALCFVLIGIPFLGGYFIALIRNVASGAEHPLPEWDDLGIKFTDGLKWILVGAVYALPIILYQMLNFFVTLSTTASTYSTIETMPTATASPLTLLLLPIGCAMFIYQLGLQFVLPVILGKLATTGNVGDAFKIGEILRLVSKNFVNLLLIFVINIVIGIIALVGLIACFVGVLFTAFYATTVNFHLYGQLFATAPMSVPPQEPVVSISEGQS